MPSDSEEAPLGRAKKLICSSSPSQRLSQPLVQRLTLRAREPRTGSIRIPRRGRLRAVTAFKMLNEGHRACGGRAHTASPPGPWLGPSTVCTATWHLPRVIKALRLSGRTSGRVARMAYLDIFAATPGTRPAGEKIAPPPARLLW